MTRRTGGATALVTLLAPLLAWLWLAGGAAADEIDGTAAWPDCTDRAEFPADAKTLLTIRATSALPDDAIRWIARYSVADVVTVATGQTPEQKISERCGHFTETYWDELTKRGLKENIGLQRQQVTQPRQVALPGCVYWKNDVAVDIARADTIDRLLSREVGLDGQQTLTDCENRGRDAKNRCDLTLRDLVQSRNPGRDLDNLGASSKPLNLPLITRFSTINLRPECFADAAAAETAFKHVLQSGGSITDAVEALDKKWGSQAPRAASLTPPNDLHFFPSPPVAVAKPLPPTGEIPIAAASPAMATADEVFRAAASPPHRGVVALEQSAVILLTEPLSAGLINTKACRDAADTAKSNGNAWPFDAKEVADQLRSSFEIAKRLQAQTADFDGAARYEVGRPIIGIVDTGLSLNDPIVPLKQFGTGQNCQIWNVGLCNLGYNIERSRDFEPIYKYKHAWHGAQVSDLALGGASFREQVPDLARKLRLRPYRIVKVTAIGMELSIDIGSVGDIVEMMNTAEGQGVNIFNLSLGASTRMDIIFGINANRNRTDILTVVAAGNNKERDKDIQFPARYGGNGLLRSKFITVAAHDGAYALASDFSASSAEYVDIAAPGCQLSWPMSESQRKLLSPEYLKAETNLFGTSFSAPLVTFAAALVKMLGIKEASEIKHRLIISARHDMPDSQVRFGSRLDILSAITIFEDQLLEKKGGSEIVRHVGEIQFPSGGLCGASLDRATHTSFRPIGSEKKEELRYFFKDADTQYSVPFDCKPSTVGVTLRKADGMETFYPWSQVAEVVTRYRAPTDE